MRRIASHQALFRRACAEGHLEEAKALRFQPRVRVNADDNVALREACAGGHTAVVEWLLQQEGVRVSSANFQALRLLASSGNVPLLRNLWTRAQALTLHTVELTETLLDTALKHHQFDVARFLLTGKDESYYAQLPPADSPEWVAALEDPLIRHCWTQVQAFRWEVVHVMDHLCPPQNPAMNVVLAESLRQEAFLYAACRHDLPALEFLCSVSQHPLMHTLLVDAAHYVSTCPAGSEASRALVQDLIVKHLKDTTSEVVEWHTSGRS